MTELGISRADINDNKMAKQVVIEKPYGKNKNDKSVDQEVEKKKTTEPSIRVTSSISLPLKYICLGVLVAQTSANILMLRFSRTQKSPGQKAYLSSTAVFCSELVKLVICYFVLLRDKEWGIGALSSYLYREITLNWRDGIKLAIPAFLYVVQNNLLFVALSILDAAVYQVTYQLKILTTAIFSVLLLNKKLNFMKWFSLLVLMIGVCIVQWPSESLPKHSHSHSWKFFGVTAVLLACLSSGFSGVFFEKIIKGTDMSIWMRNLQLAFFSVILAAVGMIYKDQEAILRDGFFQGYTGVTVYVVFSQGLGGLLIGAVVKYADNILKGFATSLSIVVSSILSYALLQDFEPTWVFLLGSCLVLLSTYLYSLPAPRMITTTTMKT